MFLWFLTATCFGWAFFEVVQGLHLSDWLGQWLGRTRTDLDRISVALHEIQESLEAGAVPVSERWARLAACAPPWGTLMKHSFTELRNSGSAVLPTLRRFRALAEAQREDWLSARASSWQALSQALVCLAIVPLMGLALTWAMPGLTARPWAWGVVCAGAFLSVTSGAIWVLSMAEAARWGGVHRQCRSWLLEAECSIEFFLALVRSGASMEIAWARACERVPDSVAQVWGRQMWQPAQEGTHALGPSLASVSALGATVKRAVQISVMEGVPCAERVESALKAFRAEMAAAARRELALLGTRALKPLYLCVAPAVIGLMGMAVYLGCGDTLTQWGAF